MEIFKQLKNLGYKHYVDLTIEELDALPIDDIEKRIEYSLVIDWFRENHQLNIEITDWSGSGFFKFEIFDTNNWNKINLTPIVWAESNEYHKKMRTSSINTYQEAREQAILKTIELCQK